ncbi:MAG: YggT family protein [Chloroflexota bacterium]|nr:YggT family protein [Chloroflexota bacterium]
MSSNDPYSNDQMGSQPTDVMPDMPMRQVTSTPSPEGGPHSSYPEVDLENIEARQEEAQTVKFAIGKLGDFLRWFAIVLEVTLAVRFVLRLIGADPTNVFAGFLYALTGIILLPFSTIVTNPSVHPPDQAFELSTLIGMGIYFLIFWFVKLFLRILITEPEEPAQ